MRTINTERLTIREFKTADLGEIYRILDVELKLRSSGEQDSSIHQRKKWLEWTISNYEQNKLQLRPPYGDHAVVLTDENEMIGVCGFIPHIGPFGQFPHYFNTVGVKNINLNFAEVGIFIATSPHYHCRGFAYEACRALIDVGFRTMRLGRLVAVAKRHNNPAIAVMKRLEMTIEMNPKHPWMQVVGFLENELV